MHLSLGHPFPNTENDGGGPVEIESKAETISEPRSNGTDVQQALSMITGPFKSIMPGFG